MASEANIEILRIILLLGNPRFVLVVFGIVKRGVWIQRLFIQRLFDPYRLDVDELVNAELGRLRGPSRCF